MKAKTYEAEINDPRQIAGAVGDSLEKGQEGLRIFFLNHSHYTIVRGRHERLEHQENSQIEEIKRGDGGDTWYHNPASRCLMASFPNQDTKNNEELVEAWGSELERLLEEDDYNATYRAGDIYDEKGRQLMGLSARNPENSSVVRACWYEAKLEDDRKFNQMLEEDGLDTSDFHDSYETLGDFYDTAMSHPVTIFEPEKLEPELPTGGRPPSPCVDRIPAD